MLTFFKKIFGKSEDPDDFVLMSNDILYNDFIVKENIQENKFVKSKDLASNSPATMANPNNQNDNINSNLSFKPNVEMQPQNNIETNFEGFKKQNQNSSYQPADMNMINIHENLKDAVVDELENTIVVPRKTNIDNKYINNINNNTPQNNKPYIDNRIGNDFSVENETSSRKPGDSWMTNDNHPQIKNVFSFNENKNYNPNNELINNDDRNSQRYKEDNIYKVNDMVPNGESQIPRTNDIMGNLQNQMPRTNDFQNLNQVNSSNTKNQWENNEVKIPPPNNFQKQNENIGNYNNELQEYGKKVKDPSDEWTYSQPSHPQVNPSRYMDEEEFEMAPINIVPINIEAKEKYDIENNYRINPELENTQNLSILKFYKDLNHFKELSEEEKIFLAVEKAKNTLHYFVKIISNPSNIHANFSIKAKLKDDIKEENLWINDVKYDNFVFEGVLGNFPKVINSVKYGDVLKVNIDDVIDWMFIENKRLIGGYSIRVARSLMDEQEREKFDKSLFFFIDEGEDHFREDLSTPEGAVTTYEEAYRRQDLNIILKCKNFKEEAKIYMLKKFGSFFYDEKSLIDLQESLKLSFIKRIEIEGFKKIDWRKRAFTRRDYIDEDLVLVTEWVFKDDGTKHRLRYYVWRNPNYMWKILCEEK